MGLRVLVLPLADSFLVDLDVFQLAYSQ